LQAGIFWSCLALHLDFSAPIHNRNIISASTPQLSKFPLARKCWVINNLLVSIFARIP